MRCVVKTKFHDIIAIRGRPSTEIAKRRKALHGDTKTDRGRGRGGERGVKLTTVLVASRSQALSGEGSPPMSS